MDTPQEQIRTIVLPADPEPIHNPRPERYPIDNNPISAIGTSIGTLTQGGGLNAAFDSNTNKPFAFSAVTFTSTINNIIGRFWGSSNNAVTAAAFTLTAPNNAMFLGSGATPYLFQGSNTNVAYTTIASGNTAGTVGEVLTVNVSPTTSYLYHQIVLTGDNTTSVAVAQLQISQAG